MVLFVELLHKITEKEGGGGASQTKKKEVINFQKNGCQTWSLRQGGWGQFGVFLTKVGYEGLASPHLHIFLQNVCMGVEEEWGPHKGSSLDARLRGPLAIPPFFPTHVTNAREQKKGCEGTFISFGP